MFLSISTTHQPTSDLGFLLHKHPDKIHERSQSFGKARVFFPEASAEHCTAALAVEVDPIGLIRRKGPPGQGFALEQYVNDRPYAASSFLAVALVDCFSTALAGRCKDRPELVATPIPLELFLPAIPCRGGLALLERLFAPLGYAIDITERPLDEEFPSWGPSRHYGLKLSGTLTLSDALSHLYVLIPVLDYDKHYWIGEDEVAKLLRHGEGWLGAHPEKELITKRFLMHRARLSRLALESLSDEGATPPDDAVLDAAEEATEEKLSLNEVRLREVVDALVESGATSVLDLGCGEGRLLKRLLGKRQFAKITGVDVSPRCLEIAAERLDLERLPELKRQRLQLLQGSLTYRDQRLEGHDAAACVEVIEHLDAHRLSFFTRNLFVFIRPRVIVLSTPNRDYNVLFPQLAAGRFRHGDHRFEWSRVEFQQWAEAAASQYGYQVAFRPVGPVDPVHGAPTQMAVFETNDFTTKARSPRKECEETEAG